VSDEVIIARVELMNHHLGVKHDESAEEEKTSIKLHGIEHFASQEDVDQPEPKNKGKCRREYRPKIEQRPLAGQ